ncbi:BlyB family putative holin accessory protein [Borrelia sp. RT1S]|uniref:BlyB family putative holin accessory protein n=1 Tax=Borrelia sp. RT1S TaxID=2898580 RepID=UPI001E466F8E|nr:BlyB family putative holin accessory protein [Borrelia sp. RT1S]UGQ17955.1 BlyB family putative holin accessory protein [Borrelia sp. RT1S]
MINKENINLGINSIQNLIDLFGYSDTSGGTLVEKGINEVVNLYSYINTLYLDSIQKMELRESKRILHDLESVNNKINRLIDAIDFDVEESLIETLRHERNKVMEITTKLLKEDLAGQDKDNE